MGDEGSLTIVKVGRELEGKYFIGKRYGIQPTVDHRPINHLERYNDNGKGMEKQQLDILYPANWQNTY